MEKISWTDQVRREEGLHRLKEERHTLHTIEKRMASWTGHILHRNCPKNMLFKERYKEG
jgi:hypothetical protein